MQPPAYGTDFPLVTPTEDVRYLFADFQLTYEDPADYDDTLVPWTPPFRIERLRGFGCEGSFADVPPHDADLRIVDADDRLVFESSTSDTFLAREWGPRHFLYEWRHETITCKVVIHTKWSPDDDPAPRNYPKDWEPANATLDARCILRQPKRVKSVTVLLTSVTQGPIDFVAGYNMLLADEPVRRGQRATTQIQFSATPGAGDGVYPDCTVPPLYIRTINNVPPARGGNFNLAAEGCYYWRRPLKEIDGSYQPWVSLYPYSSVEVGLPSSDAGTTKDALGWPTDDNRRYAHLQFGNDCLACCDCDDYVEVAQYLNRVRNRYAASAADANAARDAYNAAVTSYEEAASCFQRQPLRLNMRPQTCPSLDVVLQFCNTTGECINNLTLEADFTGSGGTATQAAGFTYITGRSYHPRRGTPLTTPYSMAGTWPVFTANWPLVRPRGSVHVRFRLVFGACVPYTVHAELTGKIAGNPIMITPAGGGDEEEAADNASAVLRCPSTVTYDPTTCS